MSSPLEWRITSDKDGFFIENEYGEDLTPGWRAVTWTGAHVKITNMAREAFDNLDSRDPPGFEGRLRGEPLMSRNEDIGGLSAFGAGALGFHEMCRCGHDFGHHAAPGAECVVLDCKCGSFLRAIPADTERYPFGCPDPDYCLVNRMCFWRCDEPKD